MRAVDMTLTSLATSPISTAPASTEGQIQIMSSPMQSQAQDGIVRITDSTLNGVIIGLLSSFGSAILIAGIFLIVYFLRYTTGGRIILDRFARPGEYDDEQAFAREEAEALEVMDDIQRSEYLRAKGRLLVSADRGFRSTVLMTTIAFIQANPPDSVPTDISLSQYLAIQEKGVSAWEFEPDLEIANCFVEARTEIEFFEQSVTLTNLPLPKQNEVYYWEAKIYDKPETSMISIGVATKPYPLFRLPGRLLLSTHWSIALANMSSGWHKYSIAYTSAGERRYNQPFKGANYGPMYVQGDVVGVGYRPRTGTIFFTRNGKKLEDVAHGLKSQNLFPAVGATGPCTVHVNFGQSGFVFIEANVKKWGLAPMTGSLAPPPPYGSEQGSILLETGREGAQSSHSYMDPRHGRTRSGNFRYGPPTSPGPVRSPTDISLAQLAHIPSHDDDPGEGPSGSGGATSSGAVDTANAPTGLGIHDPAQPPPEYSSPVTSDAGSRRSSSDGSEDAPLIRQRNPPPPIPSYSDAVAEDRVRERSNSTRPEGNSDLGSRETGRERHDTI